MPRLEFARLCENAKVKFASLWRKWPRFDPREKSRPGQLAGLRHYVFWPTFALGLLSVACGPPPPGDVPSPPSDVLSGRLWVTTDDDAPRGDFRIFLADGTLVSDSCFETYRLSRWSREAEDRIRWEEDGRPINAQILALSENTLRIRLALSSGPEEHSYAAAQVPFVCPDMPR